MRTIRALVSWPCLTPLLAGLLLTCVNTNAASASTAAQPNGLRVSDNRRYLQDATTGDPFFILADTAWNLGALKLEEVDTYLESRARHGFNVIMFALNFAPQADERNAYGHTAYAGADKTELNPAYFEYCDAVVKKCADRGMYVMLYAMWAGEKAGTMNNFTAEQLNKLGRALGGRYRGVKNVIYCAGGEATPHYIEVERVSAIGTGLKEGCNGENLVVVHPVSEHSTSEFFAAAPWLDFTMSQGKSGNAEKNTAYDAAALVQRGYDAIPVKPTMMVEHRYESGTSEDPLIQRRSLYQCVFAGGFGYAYGHNALWQMTPHTAQPWMLKGWTAGVTDWKEALETKAVGQLKHIKALLYGRRYLERIPDQSLVLAGQGEDIYTRTQVTRDGTHGSRDATYILAYISAPRDVTIDTSVLASGTLNVSWFNPETGTLEPEQKELPNSGKLVLARRSTRTDWVAVIEVSVNAPARQIAAGKFQPTWESLMQNYQCPEWFRDAKFGIWAHWSAQCVPEDGDWYARNMYIQGHRQYRSHVQKYGHPSKVGFMEIENLWKAEKWEPEKLMALYKRAGAKYFVALANHHDNFDAYDSKHHAWNSVNVGPKKDIVGTWAKLARANGLRFGVSNHSAHAWHWYQTAYGYDAEGPRAGVRYDAFTLKREDGKGKWWEGLDPQELYTGPTMVMPDGITSAREAAQWHEKNDRVWNENPPANNPRFTEKWFLRCQDLLDKYQPDLLYFDNFDLPLGQAGLDIAAHYYNANMKAHGGRLEAVLNIKGTSEKRRGALVDDIERGVAEGIRPEPWQTDTCIGSWHYERSVYDRNGYKTAVQVVQMLVDIVSKNGNLLLSIPVRGDGTIDDKETAFLESMARWMDVNAEAIFATRPWKIYGEGPSAEETPEKGHFGGARDVRTKPYISADIRFTTKGDVVYAVLMAWPEDAKALVKSLGKSSAYLSGRTIADVTLLGYAGKLEWSAEEAGLAVKLPNTPPCEHAFVLKIVTRQP